MITQPIVYKNFSPSESFQKLSEETFNKVFMRSPTLSDIKFRFEKNKEVYTAYGMVNSSSGVYVGFSSGQDVIESLKDMTIQLERRLIKVKRGHHDKEFKKSS